MRREGGVRKEREERWRRDESVSRRGVRGERRELGVERKWK